LVGIGSNSVMLYSFHNNIKIYPANMWNYCLYTGSIAGLFANMKSSPKKWPFHVFCGRLPAPNMAKKIKGTLLVCKLSSKFHHISRLQLAVNAPFQAGFLQFSKMHPAQEKLTNVGDLFKSVHSNVPGKF